MAKKIKRDINAPIELEVLKQNAQLGNVPNVTTNNQTPTWSMSSVLSNIVSGETLTIIMGKISKAINDIISHIGNKNNPHSVTKSQVGLGNVENKSGTTIRSEMTKTEVINALGYTPPTTDTKYSVATSSTLGLIKSGTDITVDSSGNVNVVGGNVNTAQTLKTARTIGISGGATGTATSFNGSANINIPVTSVKEAYLSWGGKNFTGSYGCIDAAMISDLGANRLAFMPASSIEIQYSTNGGSSWNTYSTTDSAKISLFNGSSGSNYYIGANSSSGIDKTNYQLRIIITTDIAKVYTALNKFCIYCSTSGSTGSWCTIDAKTKANVDADNDTWVNFANKVSLSGWSGYNIINISGLTTYGNYSSQYQKVRFTFGVTSHASSVNYAGLNISSIMGFGGVGWATPSNMARYGRMYTYDSSQNVTFPAQLTATQFNGKATSATKLATARKIAGTSFDGTEDISISYNNLTDKPTIPSGVQVIDNLTSSSTTASLSANQGRVLKSYLDKKVVVSESQPSGQQVGDVWYEII